MSREMGAAFRSVGALVPRNGKTDLPVETHGRDARATTSISMSKNYYCIKLLNTITKAYFMEGLFITIILLL